jgi:hypothetical protein
VRELNKEVECFIYLNYIGMDNKEIMQKLLDETKDTPLSSAEKRHILLVSLSSMQDREIDELFERTIKSILNT